MSTVPEEVKIPDEVKTEMCEGLTKGELQQWPAFKTWLPRLQKSLSLQSNPEHPFHNNPYALTGLKAQSVTRFGKRLGFVSLTATIASSNDKERPLPGSMFMRGPSVAILIILKPSNAKDDDEKYVLMTTQARIPTGSLEFLEIPAGMVDEKSNFAGVAAAEIKEETGLEIHQKDLIDMTALAMANEENKEGLPKAMFPSAGGCDEFITLYLSEKTLERQEIEEMKGKLTGLRNEGELIKLKIIKFEDLWREGARDAKALGALALYENLKRNKKL